MHRQQGRFLSVHVDDIEMAGKKPNLEPFENRRNTLNLEKPSQFLDPVHLECTQREVNRTRVSSGRLQEICLSHEFLQELLKKLLDLGKASANVITWSSDLAGHERHAFNGYANLQTKASSGCIKSPHLVSMIISSSKWSWSL